MPSGRAAAMREAVRTENRENLELERTPWNNTGFVNVIKVKNKFQARDCRFLVKAAEAVQSANSTRCQVSLIQPKKRR